MAENGIAQNLRAGGGSVGGAGHVGDLQKHCFVLAFSGERIEVEDSGFAQEPNAEMITWTMEEHEQSRKELANEFLKIV